MIAWSVIFIHLCYLESFGIPYLTPIAPFNISDMKDFIVRVPIFLMKKYPFSLQSENVERMRPMEEQRKDEDDT
ncbi:MAG: hypothetical protein HPY70_07430 [Firmicutes bacterium]|nr:hypothetical protein [Bacillota bacterium]